MRRRRLLAATAGAVGLTAGCVGSAAPSGPDDPTDTPDADTGYDTIDDVGCPSFTDADRTNCYRADGRGPDVFVVPSVTTFEEYTGDDEVETVEFTLHVDEQYRFNPNAWAVHRYADEGDEGTGWVRVGPDGADSLAATLEPGETVTWSLSTGPHPSQRDDVRQITADLDSGSTHAFRVVGDLVDGPRVEAVAVFDYLKAVP